MIISVRMEFLHRTRQLINSNVRVSLCCLQRLMSEKFLQGTQVRSARQQVSSETMPKCMGVKSLG